MVPKGKVRPLRFTELSTHKPTICNRQSARESAGPLIKYIYMPADALIPIAIIYSANLHALFLDIYGLAGARESF